jgi:hypothetical protein
MMKNAGLGGMTGRTILSFVAGQGIRLQIEDDPDGVLIEHGLFEP